MAVVAVLFLAVGCYRSHQRRSGDGGPSDAGLRDGGPLVDAGSDTGPAVCCSTWTHLRRIAIPLFGDHGTVTPRLLLNGGLPSVVVTGPSDAVGPSGAHLVRLSRDLSEQTPPVAVTTGSFTWGQPVSSGDPTSGELAVCWGTDAGDVVRLYDASGRPRSDTGVLDALARSPCIDAAFSGGHFAFLYERRNPDGSSFLRARLVDAVTLAIGADVDVPVGTASTAASLAAMDDGFALAVPGTTTVLVTFDTDGVVRAETRLPPSYRVQVVRSAGTLQLVRAFDYASPSGPEDGWALDVVDGTTLLPLAPERGLVAFPVGTAPSFDSAVDPCGKPILSTSVPSLAVVLPSDIQSISLVDPLAIAVGDTSILVLGNDAYTAFSSGEPNPQVQIDHWLCGDP